MSIEADVQLLKEENQLLINRVTNLNTDLFNARKEIEKLKNVISRAKTSVADMRDKATKLIDSL